jgi:hypothetical protein
MQDNELVFSDAQVVTTTALSTNKIDLTAVKRNIDRGEPMWCVVSVPVAVAATGSATVTFTLEADSVATMDDTPTVLYSSGAIGKAALGAGATPVRVVIPGVFAVTDRYLAVRYTVATGPLTTGSAFDARLEMDAEGIDVAV